MCRLQEDDESRLELLSPQEINISDIVGSGKSLFKFLGRK